MWEIRAIDRGDAELFRSRVARAFGNDADDDDTAQPRFDAIFEYDRTLAAYDDDDIVGTAAAFSLEVTVPGGEFVPMGGTTVVSVQPTHRRRGVLRSLMAAHLDEVSARGEPLAGLWASESSIYGRFGYGPASFRQDVSIDARAVSFRDEVDVADVAVRLLSPDEAKDLLPRLYDDARSHLAGMLSRSPGWWAHRIFADLERWRRGKSAQRYLVAESEGRQVGYAIYRQKAKWENFMADGEIDVIEVIGPDPKGALALWAFLTNVDLFPRVEWWNMPLGYQLPATVTDPRRIRGPISDGIWIRVLDVSSALGARAYESDGVVSIAVSDPDRPVNTGLYRLAVSGGEARCEVSEGVPDVSLDIDVLGGLYLGGGDALAMADAGRVEGQPAAIGLLDRMFRTSRAPWCPEVF